MKMNNKKVKNKKKEEIKYISMTTIFFPDIHSSLNFSLISPHPLPPHKSRMNLFQK